MERNEQKIGFDTTVEEHPSTEYGDFSEELDTEIDGEMCHVTIYHRFVDSTWSEFTVLADDGSVLIQNRSLTHLFLSTKET